MVVPDLLKKKSITQCQELFHAESAEAPKKKLWEKCGPRIVRLRTQEGSKPIDHFSVWHSAAPFLSFSWSVKCAWQTL
jgi:hypothetical protein